MPELHTCTTILSYTERSRVGKRRKPTRSRAEPTPMLLQALRAISVYYACILSCSDDGMSLCASLSAVNDIQRCICEFALGFLLSFPVSFQFRKVATVQCSTAKARCCPCLHASNQSLSLIRRKSREVEDESPRSTRSAVPIQALCNPRPSCCQFQEPSALIRILSRLYVRHVWPDSPTPFSLQCLVDVPCPTDAGERSCSG